MTRLLFLLDDQVLVLLDSPLAADDLVCEIQAGRWLPPEPYASWLAASTFGRLRALRQGRWVIVTPTQPLGLPEEAVAGAQPFYLNPRQMQVLQGLVEGLTSKEIAMRLNLHFRTIEAHVAEIKRVLGTTSRAQAILRAAALGLCRIKP